MKYILYVACFFFSLPVVAQSPLAGGYVAVSTPETYAYIDGIRLDSLPAAYATFSWSFTNSGLSFDYGQKEKKKKDYMLTNSKGEPFFFSENSHPFLLNFFHYNHWEYAGTEVLNGNTSKMILRKPL